MPELVIPSQEEILDSPKQRKGLFAMTFYDNAKYAGK